ncbi:MAG: hypothetical protein ACI87E_001644, partial [Mariniblastus sp.]
KIKEKVTDQAFSRIQGFLRREFEVDLSPPKKIKIDSPSHRQATPSPTRPNSSTQVEPPAVPTPGAATAPDTHAAPITFLPTRDRVAEAKKTPKIASPVPTAAELTSPVTMATAVSASQNAPQPAPWDIPDPPQPTPLIPRRSLAELMSGFMQEKNMRWGELTSGILIVLSAVGLVISLREQLSDTIPYFTTLLFMLITAAIHGAGIYTLKKWKLRNTSRGTLIIGLLLVPLNFVAACFLARRRELDDPWLWVAISVGLIAFSFMTWKSSKHLLKRGQLPLTIGIMGCGVGALVLNRSAEWGGSAWHGLLLTIPVAASFLIGTCTFDPQQWTRKRWTLRASQRALLILGLCVFASLATLSVVVFRSESRLIGLITIAPIVSTICLITSWIGSIVFRGGAIPSPIASVPRVAGEPNSATHAIQSSNRDSAEFTRTADERGMRLTGMSLKVLGAVLLGLNLLATISHPTIFVINSLFSAVGLMAMFLHQKDERMVPAAWAVFSLGMLVAVNLLGASFGFDQWTTAEQLKNALLNGKSGLSLLAIGAFVAIANTFVQSLWPTLKDPKAFRISGWITGGAVFLVGCLIAVIASLINRDNTFDVMTASGLLSLAAIGLLSVYVVVSRKNTDRKTNQPESLTFASAALLLGALIHTLVWNPTIATYVTGLIGINQSTWLVVFAVQSLVLVGVGWTCRETTQTSTGKLSSEHPEISNSPSNAHVGILTDWGAIATLALTIGTLTLIRFQTGWATGFMSVACVCWYLIGLTWTQARSDFRQLAAAPFILSTAMLVSVLLAELAVKTTWCPPVQTAEHWLVQLMALSAWSVLWSVLLGVFAKRSRFKWICDSNLKADQAVLFAGVFAIAILAFDTLAPLVAQELSSDSTWVSKFEMAGSSTRATITLGTLAIAVVVSLVVAPTGTKGLALIVIWLLAWAVGADRFGESISAASALRWLLPIGSAVGAIMVAARRPLFPAWASLRNSLGLSGPSRWSRETTQGLINTTLGIVAAVVILISTITVAQVMLNGVQSLGGPQASSWFQQIPVEISFGLPIVVMVSTFLLYAISEQRSWLATIGSLVFQYFVVIAIVLLSLSTHERLASSWFVNILKTVSLGMTAYGFAWFAFRSRILGTENPLSKTVADPSTPTTTSQTQSGWSLWARQTASQWVSQIEAHTLINGLLITSLAVLAIGRFFAVPDEPGAWISTVGSPLGVAAWAAFGVLAFFVWRNELTQSRSALSWSWLTGWMGLILVGLLAAVLDRRLSLSEDYGGWIPFQSIMLGCVAVAVVQTGLTYWLGRSAEPNNSTALAPSNPQSDGRSQTLAWPVLLVCFVGLLFAIRGSWLNSESFWLWFNVMAIICGLTSLIGWMLRDGKLSFVSAAVAVAGVSTLVWTDPHGWFNWERPDWFHLVTIALTSISMAWIAFYWVKQKQAAPGNLAGGKFPRSFLWLPNVVMLGGSLWILAAAGLQFMVEGFSQSGSSSIAHPIGMVAFAMMIGLLVLSLWNERARFLVFAGCALNLAVAIVVPAIFAHTTEARLVGVMASVAACVALWGVIWLNREKLTGVGKSVGIFHTGKIVASMQFQLPLLSLVAGGLALLAALGVIVQFEARPHRYFAALVPFLLAIGIGAHATAGIRRWLQIVCLCMVTLGVLFLGWADLEKSRMTDLPMIRLLVRSLIVLSGSMFVYGVLISRWVRAEDTWLKSLREMAVITCGLAMTNLGLVLLSEYSAFQPDTGCGLLPGESTVIALLVASMIAGLIVIALRPQNDPFSLSVQGRTAYVYAAEFVALALVAHLYFSMPFLFKFGIQAYWPYIVMALSFGGVGIASILEKRKLTVLGQPLFNTAVVLPLLVAFGVFAIDDSKAEPELVMMTVGLAYLMVSYLHRSTLSGVAAIVFGNLALWLVFNKVDFSFVNHPQWWLIPPAISTLIAGHLCQKSLTARQLSTLRYFCVIVIYVSSTMEVFISGIGDNLWPPVILAILSVLGIMAGMMLRIKSFLYLGSLFLLMAMITMVAHAHQTLNHVWPWWAFGIGLGVAILVMFGLFEKKKNEMKAIADQLKQWDA